MELPSPNGLAMSRKRCVPPLVIRQNQDAPIVGFIAGLGGFSSAIIKRFRTIDKLHTM
jgi:hypothetical protein